MTAIFFSYAGQDRMSDISKSHSHRGYELLYIHSGNCVITFDGTQVMPGGPGDVFLIPPHMSHERRNLCECLTFYAVYESDLNEYGKTIRKIVTNGDIIILQSFQMLPELNRTYDLEQSASLVQFILLRLKWHDKQEQWRQTLHPALQKACAFINANYSKAPSNEDIASSASVSVSYMFGLFHSAFGVSPQRYLLDRRMAVARQKLLDPRSNISEVAAHIGFTNLFYFSRCFKKYHGVSPTAYCNEPSRFADADSFSMSSKNRAAKQRSSSATSSDSKSN